MTIWREHEQCTTVAPDPGLDDRHPDPPGPSQKSGALLKNMCFSQNSGPFSKTHKTLGGTQGFARGPENLEKVSKKSVFGPKWPGPLLIKG